MWKIKIQKVKGNLLDKLRKLYVHKWNGHLEIFSRPQVIENSRQYLHFRTDIHREKSLGAPVTSFHLGRKEQTETSHNYYKSLLFFFKKLINFLKNFLTMLVLKCV